MGTARATVNATMLRLNPKQRTTLSESLRQVGNLTFGGLVVGQFVGSRPLSWSLLIAGATMWMILVLAGIVMLAGEEE